MSHLGEGMQGKTFGSPYLVAAAQEAPLAAQVAGQSLQASGVLQSACIPLELQALACHFFWKLTLHAHLAELV